MSFGKTFDSLYTGSMVGAGLHVFGVWNYVIANGKPPGVVELNPRLMAAIFGCEVSLVVEAIRILCEPDPESRSKECEGRRLIHDGQFLYSIPTWPKYNQMRNEEERRSQNREHARAYRQRKAASASAPDASGSASDEVGKEVSVSERQGVRFTSTSDAEGEPERESPKKPGPVERPDDVPEDLWQEWLEFRKSKRATVTQRVLDATRKTATEAGMTMSEALTYWVANGQTGFFPQPSAGQGRRRDAGTPAIVAGRRVAHPDKMPVPYDSPMGPCYCDACESARKRRAAGIVANVAARTRT